MKSTQDWIFDKRNGVYKVHPNYVPEFEVLDKKAFDKYIREMLRLSKTWGFYWDMYKYPQGRKYFDELAVCVDIEGVVKRVYTP